MHLFLLYHSYHFSPLLRRQFTNILILLAEEYEFERSAYREEDEREFPSFVRKRKKESIIILDKIF